VAVIFEVYVEPRLHLSHSPSENKICFSLHGVLCPEGPYLCPRVFFALAHARGHSLRVLLRKKTEKKRVSHKKVRKLFTLLRFHALGRPRRAQNNMLIFFFFFFFFSKKKKNYPSLLLDDYRQAIAHCCGYSP